MGGVMADQDLSHTADIVKAAIPFVDGGFKGLAEIFVKLMDLMGSLKTTGKGMQLFSVGAESSKIDIEGLLKGIRPICNAKEQEIVDRILNIFNMKRMFEMYNNMMSAMKTMQEFGGFNFGDSNSENDAENVAGNFAGSNFESIFQSFSNGSGAEKSNSAFDTGESAFDFSSGKADTQNQEESSDSNSANTSTSNPAGNGFKNNAMFEMLKTMVPPEQMSTFENLSMLLNTMSYDNNSKQDDNKEHSNG
jgi:hypothetical protein